MATRSIVPFGPQHPVLPEPIHLIQILPKEANYLNSDFKKEGYDSRQHIIF